MAGVAALGALAALMGMVREQDLFIALGPALDFLVTFARDRERSAKNDDRAGGRRRRDLRGMLSPQLIAYRVLYGRFWPSPTVEQKMTWTSPNAWRVLLSPGKRTVLLDAAGVAGVGRPRDAGNQSAKVIHSDRAWICVVCLVMVLTQIYVGGSLDTWAGAGSFGQRRLIGLTVFLVIGLAGLLHMIASAVGASRALRLHRAVRLVERRCDRTVRHRADGSTAYGHRARRVSQLRNHSATHSVPRVSLRVREGVVLPANQSFDPLISRRLLALVRCPDCHGQLDDESTGPHTVGRDRRAPLKLALLDAHGVRCGRVFESAGPDFLALKPQTAFGETTKFLEESFHADGRDETVSPPLLSAGVRNAMLRQFLDMKPGDVVLDLGCGSGRFCVWSLDSGAHVIGIDTGTFFAAEARASVDLVAGELRQLPFADASVTKAYTIDVLEHLSPEGLHATLREVSRVLIPGGSLFVYTHVRQRSPFAPVWD